MIQPILSNSESVGTDLSVFLNSAESSYDAYIGIALLERVSVDPEELQHKMLVGRLWNAGARLNALQNAFGHEPRTIKKWGNALKSGDIDHMVRAFAGRRYRKKTSPELIRYMQQLYRSRHTRNLGRNYREIIIQMTFEVFEVKISPSLASAIFRDACETVPDAETDSNDDCSIVEEQDIPGHSAPIAGSNDESTVHKSPIFPFFKQNIFPGSGVLIRHAGLVLFGLWLYLYSRLERQILCQILQGAVNVEQSKSLCHDSLAYFTPSPVKVLREQREMLDRSATLDNTLNLYRLNKKLLPDGPDMGDMFFFDPHTKEYTGQLKLLKGWCGRQHAVRRVINIDCFHTRSGRPCFMQHYSPYYDVRERFFMSLALFDRLFDKDKRKDRTFIIDRAIYGLDSLNNFQNDHVITWEKGFDGSGWEPEQETLTFFRYRRKNNKDDLHQCRFRCQESPWKRDPRFRRILVKASREDEEEVFVSILCSHPDMDVQDVVWAIFCRWLQENDFKYLDFHFGLCQLDSRAFVNFKNVADSFQDRPVECPEYKELRTSLKDHETQLAGLLLKQRRAEKKLEQQNRQVKLLINKAKKHLKYLDRKIADLIADKPASGRKKRSRINTGNLLKEMRQTSRGVEKTKKTIGSLEEKIILLEEKTQKLATRFSEAVRHQSRIQFLIDGNYQILNLRRKAYMDAIRVNAANMFYNLHGRYRVIYNNFREDHQRLRDLSRCSGFLTRNSEGQLIRLWLPGSLQPYIIKGMKEFVVQIQNEINTIEPNNNLQIELLTGPVRT